MIMVPGDEGEPEIASDITDAIIDAGKRMDDRRWVPATAGNLSMRLDEGRIAITTGGVRKGRLVPDDIIAVDLDGKPLTAWTRPSAETMMHCQLYRAFPQVGAVVHGHSVAATVLSMADTGPAVTLTGYEMLKAFGANPLGHESLDVPVVDNEQDTALLMAVVAPLLPSARAGYLIRGHGTYVWGIDMDAALARFEVLEFLLECELARRGLRAG
jgi:methylthioribulose-1-phosphate dehydratase